MAETQEVRDKVVLVGLNSPVLKKEENADEDTMEELSALVETAGGETVGIVLQNRPSPDPRTFIGEGKVAEVQLYCENTGATMVIFDNDLSPSQMRVLTELLGVQVLDRCGLILDIFAQRAKTKEGRLQVELAQYQYLLPRLTGMWTHLERQAGTSGKGPIGSKGPGETQLETDRRHIRRKIDKLREDLKEAAVTQIKQQLALDAVVAAEEIVVSDEDVEEEVKKAAANLNVPYERVTEGLDREALKVDLARDRAMAAVAVAAKPNLIAADAEDGEIKLTEVTKDEEKAAEETEAKPKKRTTKAKAKTEETAEDGEEKKPAAKKPRAKKTTAEGEEAPKKTTTRKKKAEEPKGEE